MATWQTYKLGELIDVQNGFAFKSGDLQNTGTPVIKIKNIQPPNISLKEADYYPHELILKMEQFIVEKKDILISMTGSHVSQIASAVGKVGRYGFDKPALLNQRVGKLYSKDLNQLDNDFLYYLISRPEIQFELATNAGGSANQANISPQNIKDLEVEVPDLPAQKKIAEILSALDDKIELNRRMNQTLEQMAQTLFMQYFVDGIDADNLPEGWRVGSIGDLFTLQRGFDLPSTIRAGGNVPIFSASGLNGFHNEVMVKGPGITTGRSGIIGNVYYVDEDFWPLNTSLFIKEFKASTPLHSFYVLKHTDLKGLNTGSAVPTLNRNDVHSLEAIIPDRKTVLDFEEKVKLLFNKIRQNEKENQSLINLRDTLLPKLMSGEIDVMQTQTAGQYEEVLS
ncbi:restriction endonuclease subunit S [Adhaeribacter sp. BT258]|uniref:Restriction endonuclease subunit S n=1 Tax=Adhaeribacter terrigena TaxID=2793070 RepID=A0ABS1C0S5_9BACT|nr:restriction endonuclease subunit S [Adhaeribacter terrigena]MBK0403006.1 restriction endonuclease subunit S [Adhaeribacter terrigena]